MTMPGHCVLYRFRVEPAREAQFVEAWALLTVRLRVLHGALGSRLHRGPDDVWYAYAQWLSAEARAAAFAGPPVDAAALERMRAAVVERLPEVVLDPVADYLVLPTVMTSPPPAPWRLEYADGSANHYLFACDDGAVVAFSYTPVTRAQSSSGLHDGGPPRQATLAADEPAVRAVWLQVEALLAASVAGTARAKGTGALTVTTDRVRSAVVARGPGLAVLDHLLAALGT